MRLRRALLMFGVILVTTIASLGAFATTATPSFAAAHPCYPDFPCYPA